MLGNCDFLVIVVGIIAESPMLDASSLSYVTPVAKADRDAFGFTNFSTVPSRRRSQCYWIAALIAASLYLSVFPCTTFRSTLSK